MKRAAEPARTEPKGQMPGQLDLSSPEAFRVAAAAAERAVKAAKAETERKEMVKAIAAETRRLAAVIYAHETDKPARQRPPQPKGGTDHEQRTDSHGDV